MKSTIQFKNGESIQLDRDIVQYFESENVIIVLTNPKENKKLNNENAYGYNFKGEQLWQIADLNLFHEQHDYNSIYMQEGELYLYNRCGVEVKIDAYTGNVISQELIK